MIEEVVASMPARNLIEAKPQAFLLSIAGSPPCPPVPFLVFQKNNLKVTVYTPGPGEAL